MSDQTEKERTKSRGELIASGGALAALAAMIGASCCVLPIALVNLGVSTTLIGNLVFFARAKPYLMALTLTLIAVGFAAAYWKSRRPTRRTLVLLIGASVFAVGAFLLPHFEPQILRWMDLK